jgi:hypothetical protein
VRQQPVDIRRFDMRSHTSNRVVLDVDRRGRVSLARFGFKDTQVVVDHLPSGGLVVNRAVVMTPIEAAHYADREAVQMLDQAWDSVAEERDSEFVLRSPSHEDRAE